MDSEPIRLSLARHNARVYGVEEKIQFVNDRFPKEVEGVDGIFLDPPWSLSEKDVKSWWEWAETHYSNGMIKLPKSFPVPQHRSLNVFHSLEGYPSFVLVGWGDLA
jgi:23S rRNA G2445 N2-methylase RlmL